MKGAQAFLFEEYKFIGLFIGVMALIIICGVESSIGEFWTTFAFILGALTSLLSGYIGMKVAVFSNYRCAISAQYSQTQAFRVAYRAGCVMGFSLVSLGNFFGKKYFIGFIEFSPFELAHTDCHLQQLVCEQL